MLNNQWRAFHELFAIPLKNGLTRPKAVRGLGVKMVNMGELFAHDRIDHVSMDRVPLSDKEAESYLLEPYDLLFARQSLVLEGAGKCSIFLGDNEPVTFESHLIRTRLNRKIADPQFYYYFFNSVLGRRAIETIAEQLAAAGIRGSDLARLRVPFPDLEEQRAIGHLLGALDNKIKLNRDMNQTLEALAQTLFKSWFIDFDPVLSKVEGRKPFGMNEETAKLFPERFVESELGLTPEGWQPSKLEMLVNVITGRSYASRELRDSTTALVTLKSFNRGGGYRPDGLKPYVGTYKPEQVVRNGELVVACTDVTQVAEVIGRPAVVISSSQYSTLVASLDVMIVRPHASKTTLFFYHLMRSPDYTNHILGHTNGTTVLHLSKAGLPAFMFARPSDVIMNLFSTIASSSFTQIENNYREMESLTELRNSLLTKLISGDIYVRGAEKLVAEVV